MRYTTRRRVLAACGGTIVAGMAGCLGGDSGQGASKTDGESAGGNGAPTDSGGDTEGSDDVPEALQQHEPSGQLITTETVADNTEWEFDLDTGDTLTATFDGEEYGNARIFEGDSAMIADSATIIEDRATAVQHTAEETMTFRLIVHTDSPVDVKIYVESR